MCWSPLVALAEFIFQELVTNQLFGLILCVVQLVTFYAHQDEKQVKFYKKFVLISLVGPSEARK